MTRKGRAPTIVEVARTAGVSLGTVSRVINGNPSVRPQLRERVLAAARALGYVPNPSAQSMRGRSTRAICVMVPDIANPLIAATVAGAEGVLYRGGYNMVLATSGYLLERELALLELFRRRRFDGMVLTPARDEDPAMLSALSEVEVPAVLLDREASLPLDSVAADHHAGVQQALDHLLRLGHRRIGLITGARSALTGRQRSQAYATMHKKAGLAVDPALLSVDGLLPDAGYYAAYRMLVATQPPTAIVAGANQMPDVLRAVRTLRVSVPKRLSLISIGDTDVASLYRPPLTAIRWELRKVGEAAAQLLLARLSGALEGNAPRHLTLPTELVVRASCAVPAGR